MTQESPTHTEEKKPDISFWHFLITIPIKLQRETMVFILVNTLDIYMTWRLLLRASQGGARYYESNPVAQFIIHHWGTNGMIYFKFGMVAFIVLLTQIIATKKIPLARFVVNLGTAVVVFVVFYSLWLLVSFSV